MVVGARQIFRFFRQITWFVRNNRALSKFRYQILHYLNSIIKSKISLHKTQFYINHTSHLKEAQMKAMALFQRLHSQAIGCF